ncbi:DUF2846 domain-containing protein [Coxiella burnetii]|nr:DUF2846 domain-containing protein [Coxiella burnetii]RQM62210.1 DUF2846 domain-containing protein [Coxiella burnetii]RQM68254.1 DUF2846 domain-containing protein [Coxiella burnetii]RQM81187.1 DUF2846 domain-containing protein [Coxiella burnetii]
MVYRPVCLCVPLEPRFRGLEQPPANRAVIYVYRTHHLIEGAGVKDDIYVDGILKGSIGNGGVVVIKVRPASTLLHGNYMTGSTRFPLTV